jgi:hypothetical protein
MWSFQIIDCGSRKMIKSEATFIDAAAMLRSIILRHVPVVINGSHAFAIGLQENISRKKQAA